MSTTHNNRHASAHWLLGTLLNRTQVLLLIALAGGLILVVPASAQSTEAPNTRTGSILGTVVDSGNETIPNATVVLQETVGEPLTTGMKFHLAYKSLTNPFFFGRTAAWAGVQQARDDPSEWQQGAKGYTRR